MTFQGNKPSFPSGVAELDHLVQAVDVYAGTDGVTLSGNAYGSLYTRRLPLEFLELAKTQEDFDPFKHETGGAPFAHCVMLRVCMEQSWVDAAYRYAIDSVQTKIMGDYLEVGTDDDWPDYRDSILYDDCVHNGTLYIWWVKK